MASRPQPPKIPPGTLGLLPPPEVETPSFEAPARRPVSAANQKQRERDLALWHQWNADRTPEKLEPLLTAYDPVIAQRVRQWNPPNIPSEAFRAELTRHAIKAMETYDPNRGAALATHVIGHLRKAHRYREQYQNMGYIPSAKNSLIGQVDRGVDALSTELGRDPSVEELSDHLGIPVKTLLGVQRARRKDIPGSAFEADPTAQAASRDREVLDLLPDNLTPDELVVFNHIYGREGHRQISSTNELAAELKKSAPQISRLRSSIEAKFQRYR